MDILATMFLGVVLLAAHGMAFVATSETYYETRKRIQSTAKMYDRGYLQLVEKGIFPEITLSAVEQAPQIDPTEKLVQLEYIVNSNTTLPKSIKTPTKAVLKSLRTTIQNHHDDLTVEQQHTVDTILYEHIPDTLKLFASVPVREQKKHAYKVQKNLMSMTSALTDIQKNITSTNIRQLKTNNLYLEEKFKTPSLEQ